MGKKNQDLNKIKEAFAKAFVDALSTKSVTKLAELVQSHDDQEYLTDDRSKLTISKEEYNKIVIARTEEFLAEANRFIERRNADPNSQLTSSNIEKIDSSDFIFQNEGFQVIEKLHISMKTRLIDGVNYEVNFRFENSLFLQGKIKISNWFFVKYSESFWDDINEENTPYPKIENKEKLNKLFEHVDTEFKDHIHNWNAWYLHEGDLVLDKYDLKVNLIVTGNLTVKEPLVEVIHELVVFGETQLNALYLDEDNDVVFLGGIKFKVGLFILSSGAFQVFNQPQGPLICTYSESNEIKDSDGVQCLQDYAMGDFNGDVTALVQDKYLEEEDGSFLVDFDQVIEALRKGDNIFNKK